MSSSRAAAVLVATLLVGSLVASIPAAGQSAEYSGEIELTGDAAADGSQYQYDLNNSSDISDFQVSVTGVDNVASDSTSGSLSSGTEDSFEVVTDKPPKSEEITLSAPYDQRDESVSGTVSGSGSETISPSGTWSVSDATVDLQGITEPSNFDNRDSSNQIASMGPGEFYNQTIPTRSSQGRIKSVTVLMRGESSAPERQGRLYLPDGSISEEITYDTDPYGVDAYTYDGSTFPTEVGKDYDIGIKHTGPSSTDKYLAYYGMLVEYEDDTTAYVNGQSNSETGSTTISLSSGSSETIDFSDIDGTLDYSINWDETDAVGDISGTVGGSSISQSGALTTDFTRSVDLSDGSNSVDLSYSGTSDALDYSASWDETTETRDPNVNINGESAGVSGTLADGETTNLSVSDSWIKNGTNNVSISTSSPSGGPGSLVGFNYTHLTTGPSESTTINATTWESSINTTKGFDSDQSNANARITFSDSVVDVANIEQRVNGGEWSTPSSWSMSGSTLNVSVGDLSAGDSVSVRAEGRKVDVVGGSVDVVDPTVEGAELSTRMRVTGVTGDGVEIDVSGTNPSDKIHYLASSDWSASDRARVGSGGSQVLELPNAVEDTEATVETAPLSVEPQTGEAIVEIDNADEPRFTISPGETEGDYLEIGYIDTTSGTTYELVAPEDDRVVDRGTASSPVWFSAPDDPKTYTIEIGEATAAVGGVVGASGGGGGGFGGPILIGVAMLGVIGSAYAGRRIGVSWRLSIPVGIVAAIGVAELASPRSLVATISGDLLRGSAEPLVATVVGTVLLGGLIVADRRTSWDIPRWLYGGVALAALAWIGTAISPELLSGSSQPLVALAAGGTVILGLVYVQWQTDREIPTLAVGTVGALAAIWIAESIAPGAVTDPLRAGLEEVGPLAILAILGIVIYAVRGWVRSRNTPETQVTFSLRGGNQ